MNYHPVVTLYANRWGDLTSYDCERTVEILRESLQDHEKIMNVSWYSMAKAIKDSQTAFAVASESDLYTLFRNTHHYGWRDSNFRNLIQEIVSGIDVEDVPLEDYL